MMSGDQERIAGQLYDAQRAIMRVRYERGWTQQEAANALGIDRVSLSYIENGKQNLTVAMVLRMSLVYERTVAELLKLSQWES